MLRFLSEAKRKLQQRAGLLFLALVLVSNVSHAQNTGTSPDPVGEWHGTYTCGQGVTGVRLNVGPLRADGYPTTFSFFPVPGRTAPSGEFRAVLRLEAARKRVELRPVAWVSQPPGYSMVPFRGELTNDGAKMIGQVLADGCGAMSVDRGGAVRQEATSPSTPAPAPQSAQGTNRYERRDGIVFGTPTKPRRSIVGETPPEVDRRAKAAAFVQDLLGGWDGAIYGQGVRPVRISLIFERSAALETGAALSVRLDHPTFAPAAYALFLEEDGANGRIAKANATARERGANGVFEASLGKTRLIKDGFGRDVLVMLMVGRSRELAYVFRRDPKETSSFAQRCKAQEAWIQARSQSWDQARKLKTTFFGGLKKYDAGAASLLDAWADKTVKEHFGVTIAEMDLERVNRLLRDARDCAVTNPALWRNELMEGIVDVERINRDWAVMSTGLNQQPLSPTVSLPTYQYAVTTLQARMKDAESRLPEMLAGVDRAGSIEAMDALLASQAEALSFVRPTILSEMLKPALARVEELRGGDALRIASERQTKAARRMAGVVLPESAIPPHRLPLIRALAAGQLTTPSGQSTTYFGGIVAESIERCGLPATPIERFSLRGLLLASIDRATLGDAYADRDLSKTLGSSYGGQAAFIEGVATARAIGCSDPFLKVVIDALVDLTTTAGTAADGRAGTFVRTCTLERPQSQCECVAREGRAALPGIDGETFSPTVFRRIVNANPGVALKVGSTCGVSNY